MAETLQQKFQGFLNTGAKPEEVAHQFKERYGFSHTEVPPDTDVSKLDSMAPAIKGALSMRDTVAQSGAPAPEKTFPYDKPIPPHPAPPAQEGTTLGHMLGGIAQEGGKTLSRYVPEEAGNLTGLAAGLLPTERDTAGKVKGYAINAAQAQDQAIDEGKNHPRIQNAEVDAGNMQAGGWRMLQELANAGPPLEHDDTLTR